ncbi:MAG: RNA methyltransferase [Methylophilaceae bacterium]
MQTVSMDFEKITIILCRTSHPGNIGSAARAMLTMGFKNLKLVSPNTFPSSEAVALASGAEEVLNQAKLYTSIEEAIAEHQCVIGFSARQRELTQPHINLTSLAHTLNESYADQEIAILFGNETNGLSNDEIKHCHLLCFIDSNPDYASLNLAQAVQLCCYELRMASNKSEGLLINAKQKDFVSADRMNGFFDHLEETLDQIGFLKKVQGERLMHRLRLLFNRTQLDEEEVNILRGILKETQKKIK